MWEELGIEPTSDLREIRRAYAGRLKAIDPDRDPAAFQRLRHAFEDALAWTEEEEGPPRTASAPRQPPQPAIGEAVSAPVTAFRSALAAGDPEAACGHLSAALAQGLVSLALQDELFAELMAVAVTDRSLPAERFRAMAQLGNWDAGVNGTRNEGDLRERVLLRLEAEGWYDGMLAAAARNGTWFRRNHHLFHGPGGARRRKAHADERNEARILLGRVPRCLFYYLSDRRSMVRVLAHYERYRWWLDGRIDAQRLAWLERVVQRPAWQARLADFLWIIFLPTALLLVVLNLFRW